MHSQVQALKAGRFQAWVELAPPPPPRRAHRLRVCRPGPRRGGRPFVLALKPVRLSSTLHEAQPAERLVLGQRRVGAVLGGRGHRRRVVGVQVDIETNGLGKRCTFKELNETKRFQHTGSTRCQPAPPYRVRDIMDVAALWSFEPPTRTIPRRGVSTA